MENGCKLCPRACGADRKNGVRGICGVADEIYIARAALHLWEEPCISVGAGSGTVFFSGCPLKCVFCQNREISRAEAGLPISSDRLYDIFFELKARGAANINLVPPTHYAAHIAPVLRQAKRDGLGLPIVYNCGGYESVETLRMLEGLIDVYMPDFKYMSSDLAKRYSHAENYPAAAKRAIAEMVRQKPFPYFDGEKLISGVLVRHLVLPGCVEDSIKILDYLHEEYGDDIFISIMSQYTPPQGMTGDLSRKLSKEEYHQVLSHMEALGMQNCFTQSGESAEESFIPPFDTTGVLPF